MPALDLLVKMQASHTHMALVIDEYGGTDGLVSIEDVVEAIVGDIEDEHDETERPEIVASGEGAYVVEARASLEDVSKAIGFDFSALADAEDVDTIGGLLTAAAGRVPGRGEIVAGPGDFEFEVLDADPRRVKRLKILPRAILRAPRLRGAPAPARGAPKRTRRPRPTSRGPPIDERRGGEFESGRIPRYGRTDANRLDRKTRQCPCRNRRSSPAKARSASSPKTSSSPGAGRGARSLFSAARRAPLAMPPLSFAPAMIVPLALAVWLIDGSVDRGPREATRWASLRAAFGAGWWWGFGYFAAGLWWLGSAFLVEPDKFAWALPLGVLGLPAVLAFFPALGFALARLLWRPGACARLGARGRPRGERMAALRRLHRLSLERDRHGAGAKRRVRADRLDRRPARADARGGGDIRRAGDAVDRERRRARRWAPTMLAALALAAIYGFGALRLDAPASAATPGVKLRLMQPNVAQGADFVPDNGLAIVRRYLALSDRATSPTTSGVADVTHLIWPESAFPFILSREGQALAEIADFLRGGAILVTGAARMEERDRAEGRLHFFNAIEVLDRRGLLPERYDKHHLVPFGEYMPFSQAFERIGVTQFIHFPGGFDAGTRTEPDPHPRPAERSGLDLLRGDFPQRARRGGRRRRRPAALAAQRDGRRMVRLDLRALPAFRSGAPAGDRTRPAARARGQHRHIGRHRRPGANPGRGAAGGRGRARQPVASGLCRRPGNTDGDRRRRA